MGGDGHERAKRQVEKTEISLNKARDNGLPSNYAHLTIQNYREKL
jgi:hypothetical protein